MPVVGTKRIEVDGREMFLPSQDVALEHLIKEGLRIEAALAPLKAEFEQVKAELVNIARPRLLGRKSITLTSPSGCAAQVVFGAENRVNEEAALALKSELPEHVFSAIFTEAKSYKLAKGYTAFVKQPQSADLQKLKIKVAACVEVHAKKPSVKLLGDVGDAAEPTEISDDE